MLLRILLLVEIHSRLTWSSSVLLRWYLVWGILSTSRHRLSGYIVLLLSGLVDWLAHRNTLNWESLYWVKCHFPLLCGRHNMLNVVRLSLWGRRNEGTSLNYLRTPVWRELGLLNCTVVGHRGLVKINRKNRFVTFSNLSKCFVFNTYL